MSQPLGLSTGAINTGVTAGAIGVPAATYGAYSGASFVLLLGIILTLAVMFVSAFMFVRGQRAHRAQSRLLSADLLPVQPSRSNRVWRR